MEPFKENKIEDSLDTFTENDLTSAEEEIKDTKEVGQADDKKDTKKLLMLIGIFIGAFVLIFASIKLIDFREKSEVITLDDFHQMNIDGKETEYNYMYNGHSFVKYQGLWYTQVKNDNDITFDFGLHFGPRELEDVSIEGIITEDFLEQELYVSFNPLSENMQYVGLATSELSLNLVKGFGLAPKVACSQNKTSVCEDRPIISSCESDKAVILFKKGEEAKVTMNENCIILYGEMEELVKSTDRFLLRLYSIMK